MTLSSCLTAPVECLLVDRVFPFKHPTQMPLPGSTEASHAQWFGTICHTTFYKPSCCSQVYTSELRTCLDSFNAQKSTAVESRLYQLTHEAILLRDKRLRANTSEGRFKTNMPASVHAHLMVSLQHSMSILVQSRWRSFGSLYNSAKCAKHAV